MTIEVPVMELSVEIAAAVLEEMYYANVTAPQELYVHDEVNRCSYYTEEAQDTFNTLNDVVETMIRSCMLNADIQEIT